MAKDQGYNTKVPVPPGKSTMGRDIPKDDGKGIGKQGSPVKTVPDSGLVAKDSPFGSGTGVIDGKV
ncbi:MAG: hypothetical protein JO269_09570 [Burkholderiaceae bacterium]|nr:hypothetical protein [Burkholderiaceae bacterium]